MKNDNILMEEYLKICNNSNIVNQDIINQGILKKAFDKLTSYFTCFNGLGTLSEQLSTGKVRR